MRKKTGLWEGLRRATEKNGLAKAFAVVLNWHETKHPEIRDIRLGYDLCGFPLIGIHWRDKQGRLCDSYAPAGYPDITNLFEVSLKKHPPTRIISHI